MASIVHNGQSYPIPEGATAEETRKSLAAAGLAELSNATLEKKGEDYHVNIRTGKKG